MNATELFFNTIQSGKTENVKLQLEHNPDLVHTKDPRGFTPLIFATYFDKEDIAKVLIEHKAPIDATDASGNTALLGVCFKGNLRLVEYLISKGANINATNNNGVTPLIFSVMYNKEAVVRLLLEKGANSSFQDNEGKSALDHAKIRGFNNLIDLIG
jgi:ankyrin repeat protein